MRWPVPGVWQGELRLLPRLLSIFSAMWSSQLFIMRTYMWTCVTTSFCFHPYFLSKINPPPPPTTFWPGERQQEEFRSGANLVKILENGKAKQCFGSIRSEDPDPHPESRSGSRRANIIPKNRKKLRIFMFWSAKYSILMAGEGFSCSLDVLYEGLGICT